MTATESAKAKLRAQGDLKFAEDVNVAVALPDYGNARRHYLPASTNDKLSSLSPRIQKPVQANGKGGSKINKSLTSARDGKHSVPMIAVCSSIESFLMVTLFSPVYLVIRNHIIAH
ncbi:hypothetical protein ACS0TY_002582 [Phlomoides rotata]